MAFATTNLSAGVSGNHRTVSGSWSGVVGDAAGSIAIGSANVISYDFDPNLTTGPTEKPICSASTSGNTTTLTVYNHQTVTSGKFRIEFI